MRGSFEIHECQATTECPDLAAPVACQPTGRHVADRVRMGRALALSMVAIAAGILIFSRPSVPSTAIASMALGIDVPAGYRVEQSF
jgi:hypothetical protein